MEQKRSARLIPRDISENLGKLPPQAIDLEEAVLGAVLLEKNAIIEVAGFLRAEHFYNDAHKEIYLAIQSLFAAGNPIDILTVIKTLRTAGMLEVVGGATRLAEITSKMSSSANIEHHARILVEFAMKRSLIHLAATVQNAAYDDTQDIFSLIDQTNLELQGVLDDAIGSKGEVSIKDIATQLVLQVQGRQSGVHSGLDTGYRVLDALLNGFQPGDLIIEAARPGMGKSLMAAQAARQMAERGIPVGIFSLEMSAIQLIERLAVAECGIDADKIKKGIMNEHEFRLFMDACGRLAKLPLHIDDTPFMTIVELRARMMRMVAKYKVQFVVADYLQLIKGSGKPGQNRDQEIGEITRTLKGSAKEIGIPILALSQLSRGLETRGGTKRPQLSDLRESGNIEQDADIVMFLYRPEYYKITVDEDGYSTSGLCEVIVAKNRNGALDTVKLKFIGKLTKFDEWTMEQRQDQGQYIKDHVKSVLPSEKAVEDFNPDDRPF